MVLWARPVRWLLNSMLFVIAILFAAGCGGSGGDSDSDSDSDSEMISELGETDSHRAGQDCQQCHDELTVAGTVYDAGNPTEVKPDVLVRLHAQADQSSTLVAEVEVDAKGNFYTTAPIAFGTGLYAVVVDGADASLFMMTPVTANDGACNDCHDGNTVPVIFD